VRTRGKPRQHPTVLAHQEFFEVPGDLARELGAFACQQTIELVTIRAIDVKLAAHRESHPVVEAAERLNVFPVPGSCPAN
jgi:hypothetical protein